MYCFHKIKYSLFSTLSPFPSCLYVFITLSLLSGFITVKNVMNRIFCKKYSVLSVSSVRNPDRLLSSLSLRHTSGSPGLSAFLRFTNILCCEYDYPAPHLHTNKQYILTYTTYVNINK